MKKGIALVLSGVLVLGGITAFAHGNSENGLVEKTYEDSIKTESISEDMGYTNRTNDFYKDMINIMRNNGYEDMAVYMNNEDYEAMDKFMNTMTEEDYNKMIEIMNNNGYEYMAKMMNALNRDEMLQMHNDMGGARGMMGMMNGFSKW
mgnify:CR=1 FL=1